MELRGTPGVWVEPGIALITTSIENAVRAASSGDASAILKAYEDLSGYEGPAISPAPQPAAALTDTLRGQSRELQRAYIWIAIGWGMIALVLWEPGSWPQAAGALLCTVIALTAAWRAIGLNPARNPFD